MWYKVQNVRQTGALAWLWIEIITDQAEVIRYNDIQVDNCMEPMARTYESLQGVAMCRHCVNTNVCQAFRLF